MKTEILMFIVKFLIATIGAQIIIIVGAFIAECIHKYRAARLLYSMNSVAIPIKLFQTKTEDMCKILDEKYKGKNCKCWGCEKYPVCHNIKNKSYKK